MPATVQQLKNRLQVISAEVAVIDKALRGQGSYGGVAMKAASHDQQEILRGRYMANAEEQRDLQRRLGRLAQPQLAQAPPAFGNGSGPAGTTTTVNRKGPGRGNSKTQAKPNKGNKTSYHDSEGGGGKKRKATTAYPTGPTSKKRKSNNGKGKGTSSARNAGGTKHKAAVRGSRGVTAQTKRSKASLNRMKQEGPSSEVKGLTFRTDFTWQKTYESLVVVAAKMWGVKADRRAASEFISSNVKTTGAETSELVQKLKGTAENNFEGVQVDVAKLVKVCHKDKDVSRFLLGDTDRTNRQKRITQKFTSYASKKGTTKSQTKLFFGTAKDGRLKRMLLKLK